MLDRPGAEPLLADKNPLRLGTDLFQKFPGDKPVVDYDVRGAQKNKAPYADQVGAPGSGADQVAFALHILKPFPK